MVFKLGNESYGVDIAAVREVIRIQAITAIPRTPDFVRGVTNLRGKVTPVMDLAVRLGLISRGETRDSRIIVVIIGGREAGMIVDEVTEVLRIEDSAVQPLHALLLADGSAHIIGIVKHGEQLVMALDPELLLSDSEKGMLHSLG